MTAEVRVVLADDEQLVRAGLRMILEAADGITVVGEAADGIDAVRQATALVPDVVLMDFQMPGLSGTDATRKVLAVVGNRVRVVILTTFSESDVLYAALTAGASGFLLKDMPAVQLVGGIRAVARGEELLAPVLTRRLIERFVAAPRRRDDPRLRRLTEREREVLQLLARGQSNTEIAATLVVGRETVKTHISRIFYKLDVRDRVHAVIYAYQSGLVDPTR